ncbi:hypothetical protein C0J52_01290 [Blattella germanica]|nr:hypothetical protein C0J52_01290 [Blattella germanica]
MDVQILPRVSKETKLKVREALNLDEATIKEAVETLKAWLEIQPHLPHHEDEWTNKMRNYREVFRKREQMKSDESRRPNREKFEHEMFGVEGSFRKLNID